MIWAINSLRNYSAARVLAGLLVCVLESMAYADALDAKVLQDDFLGGIAQALNSYEIDVATNLNARDLVRQRILRPRLGRFPDLPLDSLADSTEIETWEAEYLSSEIGGIAIISNDVGLLIEDSPEFLQTWLGSESDHRIFITFYRDDLPAAEKIQAVVSTYDYPARMFFGAQELALAGNLFATAAQRLAIDSAAARRYRSKITELDYLGKRVRRNSDSIFKAGGNKGNNSLARREPAVFLKQTLGDEFNQSTIREIVVPGGVALGELATLSIAASSMQFAGGSLQIVDTELNAWQLPPLDLASTKALFDFVERSQHIHSDAIVDIDADGRVRISSALRNTEVGYEIMHADTQPFEYVPNLPVTKSVVIDVGVAWYPSSSPGILAFETDYEVRFLSANNMRIAQTRAALAYQFESENKAVTYKDAWGGYVRRLRDNLDYSGLGSSMTGIANYAGWIALLRKLHADKVPFLQGRYEFMKIDKSGRETPARY